MNPPPITIRDLLAANAPAVPTWFEPINPSHPPVPEAEKELSPEDYEFWMKLDHTQRSDARVAASSPAVRVFAERYFIYRRQMRTWQRQLKGAAMIQWPYAYADLVLASRDEIDKQALAIHTAPRASQPSSTDSQPR